MGVTASSAEVSAAFLALQGSVDLPIPWHRFEGAISIVQVISDRFYVIVYV